jgi:hypothetical protein
MSNVEMTGLVMADETNVVVALQLGTIVLHPVIEAIEVAPPPPMAKLVLKELGHELCLMAAAAVI